MTGNTASAQTAPPLATTASFTVPGGSAATNTGASVVVGDLGIWPNLAGSIIGFPPGAFTGPLLAGNAVAQQAHTERTTAAESAR